MERGADNGGVDPAASADGADRELLRQLLEGLSLSGSEARTMEVLLRLGTATLNQLAQGSGISRSNLYPVLDSLAARGIAQRLSGRYALWSTPGRAVVLATLEQAEEARAAATRASFQRRLEEAKSVLARLPVTAERATSLITVVDGGRAALIYTEAMATVDSRILVFNKGPYVGDLKPSKDVLGALARGVPARALYQSDEIEDLRHCAEAYERAGVDQRVVDRLPVSMAVLGDDLVVVTLPPDDGSSDDVVTAAVMHSRALVELATAAFEYLWSKGRPMESLQAQYEASASA
ncbi:MAG TPA: helix-turn-helix domain-containing protein [Acidimicrobiales bacterium]|nr:helix-turn-helix domain-containing protein [Acidimicrobiales bacterium]